MRKALLFTLLLLAALCVLLLAGAFPRIGAPEVYRSGAMYLAGIGAFVLCLVGTVRTVRSRAGRRRWWLSGAHAFLALLLVGVAVDALYGVRQSVVLPALGGHEVHEIRTPQGEVLPLGFGLSIEQFSVTYYEGTQQVKEYAARCRVKDEADTMADITVNRPLNHKGWRLSLEDYRNMRGVTMVRLQLRRSPGREAVRAGVVGAWLCLTLWCWTSLRRKEETC